MKLGIFFQAVKIILPNSYRFHLVITHPINVFSQIPGVDLDSKMALQVQPTLKSWLPLEGCSIDFHILIWGKIGSVMSKSSHRALNSFSSFMNHYFVE